MVSIWRWTFHELSSGSFKIWKNIIGIYRRKHWKNFLEVILKIVENLQKTKNVQPNASRALQLAADFRVPFQFPPILEFLHFSFFSLRIGIKFLLCVVEMSFCNCLNPIQFWSGTDRKLYASVLETLFCSPFQHNESVQIS